MTDRTANPSPIALVQNPALGAFLLWTFGISYQKQKVTDLPVLPYYFLVLPLLLHAETLEQIRSTYPVSGLAQLAKKLADRRELLLSLHGRTLSMRELTLESIAVGVTSKLLHLDYQTAKLRSNAVRPPAAPQRLKYHVRGAEKLGQWFARSTPDQIFSLLRVEP